MTDIYEQHMRANPGLDRTVYTREYWDGLIATSWKGIDYRIPMVPPVPGRVHITRTGERVTDVSDYEPSGQYADYDLSQRDLVGYAT